MSMPPEPPAALSPEQAVLADGPVLGTGSIANADTVLGGGPSAASGSSSSPSGPEPGEWSFRDWPVGGDISFQLTSEQSGSIISLFGGIKDRAADQPLFLHLGVGVGNPSDTLPELNNNTAGMDLDLRLWQVNPPFLQDASHKGFFVVAVNFNGDDVGNSIATEFRENGAKIDNYEGHQLGRFPLSPADVDARAAWDAIKSVADMAAAVCVINAINNDEFGGILNLIPAHPKKYGFYIKSYGEKQYAEIFFHARKTQWRKEFYTTRLVSIDQLRPAVKPVKIQGVTWP